VITEQDLIGTWLLQSWEARDAGTDEIRYPYGEGAKGILMYTTDGWMSAALCSKQREPFPAYDKPADVPTELKAEAFDQYFHYSSTYEIKGDEVFHDVKFSSNPSFPGTMQVRKMNLEGNILTLSVENAGGKQHLQWKRSSVADS